MPSVELRSSDKFFAHLCRIFAGHLGQQAKAQWFRKPQQVDERIPGQIERVRDNRLYMLVNCEHWDEIRA